LNLAQEFRTVDFGHARVGDNDVECTRGQSRQSLLSAAGKFHVPFLGHGTKRSLQTLQHQWLVVYQ
jgi:hypothetical protein